MENYNKVSNKEVLEIINKLLEERFYSNDLSLKKEVHVFLHKDEADTWLENLDIYKVTISLEDNEELRGHIGIGHLE